MALNIEGSQGPVQVMRVSEATLLGAKSEATLASAVTTRRPVTLKRRWVVPADDRDQVAWP